MNARIGNIYPKPTKPSAKDLGRWLKQSMDELAEEYAGEFGYDTCDEEDKLYILTELFRRGWIE